MGYGHNMNENWDHMIPREVTKEIVRAVDIVLIRDTTMELLRLPVYFSSRSVRNLDNILLSEKVIS